MGSASIPKLRINFTPFFLLLLASLLVKTETVRAQPKVGYASALHSFFSEKVKEYFFSGFELGLAVTTEKRDINDLLILENTVSTSPFGFTNGVERLLKQDVVAITGFSPSQDALLASKVTLKAKTLAIFPTAAHSALDGLGPLVVSVTPSMTQYIETLLKVILKKQPNKRGLLISNPTDIYCRDQEEIFRKLLQKEEYRSIQVTVLHLNKDFELSGPDLKKLSSGEFGYIYMATYPDMSFQVLTQMNTVGLDLPIFAVCSWVLDSDLLRRLLVRHRSPVYSLSLWIPGSKSSQKFEMEFRKKYGREPDIIASYGFDLGLVIGTTLRRIQGVPTRESFIQAFYDYPCFGGGTTGRICFSSSGGHAVRKLTLVRFSQGGFVPVAGEISR